MIQSNLMKFKKFFLIGALALLATACGDDFDDEEYYDENISLSYNFDENGCRTGKHAFDSRQAYCAALSNDGLNRGCANTLRYQTFRQNCRGYNWDGPVPRV